MLELVRRISHRPLALLLLVVLLGALMPGSEARARALAISVGPTFCRRGRLDLRTLIEDRRPVGYVLVVPRGVPVRPALAPRVELLSTLAGQQRALIAINGGFFDQTDGAPASYVEVGGKIVADPHRDPALVGNSALKPYLGRIFDRPEWRLWKTPLGTTMDIESHDEGPAHGWTLLDALQAGPSLVPEVSLEQGGFVRKGGDPLLPERPRGRSALGIRADGSLVLACVPEHLSVGLTIAQLRRLMIALGAQQAMALDGGPSASIVARPDVPGAAWWGYDARVRSGLMVGLKPLSRPAS